MRNIMAAAVSLALCLGLAASPVSAQDAQDTQDALVITSAQEFAAFAENCRLDSYSAGLSVRLDSDIDLTGIDWEGVPVFCGSFDGNGHVISGLSVTGEGSQLGLFRTLTQTAQVRNLTVQGTVEPDGSRCEIGGIAGRNAGQILDCVFEGSVAGADSVGGAVGVNEVTGVVENVAVRGTVGGSHFVGGVAGENAGVVRSCVNEADVNTTEQQNQIELSDITLDALTGSESAGVSTDVGGIAGTSSGVIRGCVNKGGVGYLRMGYNVGGIAGSQSGYLAGCANSGAVQGRKDTGGIVGQLNPVARVQYEEDTFQILQGQLNTLNQLAGQASAHAQSGAAAISNGLSSLQSQAGSAKQAAGALVPQEGQLPSLPDHDSVTAAKNDIAGRVSTMNQTVAGMASSAQGAAGALADDLQSITNQMNAVNATVTGARDTLGVEFADVSDEDTAEDLSAKVEDCVNTGTVSAEWNCGGVAGTIAPEAALDSAEEIDFSGEESLYLQGELRAVILGCENSGAVSASKENAGGVAGWAAMGLVKNCTAAAGVGDSGADCVGGIAGRSAAFLRENSAKCRLAGDVGVGGIAGEGTIATDCRSMVLVESASEQCGAVFGRREDSDEENPLHGNYYLPVGGDIGGVDGVSYDGMAQPLGRDEFLALEGLPELFRGVTLSFVHEDGAVQTLTTEPDGAIDPALVPELPAKEGYTGFWEGIDDVDWNCIPFDRTFYARYEMRDPVRESDAVREESGLPVLLVQGAEPGDGTVRILCADEAPDDAAAPVETWTLAEPAPADGLTVRYLPPEGRDAEKLTVMILSDGAWRDAAASVDGSRLVFRMEAGEAVFAVAQTSPAYWIPCAAAAAFAAALGAGVWLHRKRKKKASV